MYFLSMEMIQIRTEIRGKWFPEKSSTAGSRTKDLTLCRPACYRLRHATSTICEHPVWMKYIILKIIIFFGPSDTHKPLLIKCHQMSKKLQRFELFWRWSEQKKNVCLFLAEFWTRMTLHFCYEMTVTLHLWQ